MYYMLMRGLRRTPDHCYYFMAPTAWHCHEYLFLINGQWHRKIDSPGFCRVHQITRNEAADLLRVIRKP